MRTIKYFGIGSLSVGIIAMFCGFYLIGLFLTFAFLVLSVVYALNNHDRQTHQPEPPTPTYKMIQDIINKS